MHYHTGPTAEVEVEDLYVEFILKFDQTKALTALFRAPDWIDTGWKYLRMNSNGATIYSDKLWYTEPRITAETILMNTLKHESGFIAIENKLVRINDIACANIAKIKRKVTVTRPEPSPIRNP